MCTARRPVGGDIQPQLVVPTRTLVDKTFRTMLVQRQFATLPSTPHPRGESVSALNRERHCQGKALRGAVFEQAVTDEIKRRDVKRT